MPTFGESIGREEQATEYYELGKTMHVVIGPHSNPTEVYDINVGGWLKHAEQYTYDADGRVTRVDESGRVLGWQDGVPADESGNVDAATVQSQKTNVSEMSDLSEVLYSRADGASGYDAAGRLMTYRYKDVHAEYGNPTDTRTFVYTYEARDSYLESVISGTSTNPNYRATTSTSTYDAYGRRLSVQETTPLADYSQTLERLRYFSYDGDGRILSRRDGELKDGSFTQVVTDPRNPAPEFISDAQWTAMSTTEKAAAATAGLNQRFVYASGQQIARLNQAGGMDVSSQLTAYESSTLGSSTAVVMEGDTLQTVAERVYGNSSLWYVLAEANAISGSLVAGTTLRVPEVKVSSNDAGTFKPYDPGAVIGPTSPGLPYITPPPKQGCNAVGMIIMVAIAVIVTAYTAGLAAGGFGVTATATGSTAAASTSALGTAALAGASASGVTFGTALTGSLAASSMGTALGLSAGIGAFAGSVASQVVGKALGVVDHFSLRSAVGAGLTAGLTSGLASALHGSTSQLIASKTGAGRIAASAVGTALAGYAGASIAGNAFSWRSIAASAVSNVVTAKFLQGALGMPATPAAGGAGTIAQDIVGGMVGGVVSLHVRRGFGFDDQIDYGRIAADAFGNALGNAAVRGIQSWQARKSPDRLERLPDGGALHRDGSVSYGIFKPMTAAEATAELQAKLSSVGISAVESMGDHDVGPVANILNSDGSINWREYSADSKSAYERVIATPGKTANDAMETAQWVQMRQILDRAVELFPGAKPEYQGRLEEIRRTYTAALLSKDVYFDGAGIPELMPQGVHRLSTPAELAGYGLTIGKVQANDTIGYFGALYTGSAWDYRSNTTVKEIYYANRGTEAGAAGRLDWINNILQGVGRGQEAPQYRRAIEIAKELSDHAGDARLTFIGHSLGGGLASAQALSTHREGITFNSAGLRAETLNIPLDYAQAEKSITAVYVKNEVLSWIQGPGGPIVGAAAAAAIDFAAMPFEAISGLSDDALGAYAVTAIVDMPEAVGRRVALDGRMAWNRYETYQGGGNPMPGDYVRTSPYGPNFGDMTMSQMGLAAMSSKQFQSVMHNMSEMHSMSTVLYSLYADMGLHSLQPNIRSTMWRH